MKTKLTLFVAVLAAVLFGAGCASVPKPDVANAVKWKGHWYVYFSSRSTWDTAKKECEKLGGHLVIINSEEENIFVHTLARKHDTESVYTWFGASDRDGKAGEAKWVDGSLVSDGFSNWGDDPVKLGGDWDHGTMILRHGPNTEKMAVQSWDFGGRGQKWTYVCEWE